MNFYLDFDYTLFDNYAFRQGLYKILEDNGLDETYLRLTPELTEEGQKLLNIKEFFYNLSKTKNIPIEKFLEPLDKLYSRCHEFVYDDTIEFLKYLKSIGARVYILTWGERHFQEEKIKASGLNKYVDGIIYSEKLKYTCNDIDYKSGIFIDDSPRDLRGIYNRGGEVYRVIRKNAKNSDKMLNIKDIVEVHNLKEIQKIIENKIKTYKE